MRSSQLKLFKTPGLAYGGTLRNTRKGRAHGRPLSVKHTMHLVLRSSKAKGDWSFLKPRNRHKIDQILLKFSRRFGVKILSAANVGNHLHMQIQLSSRATYRPFIRAITAAIAISITGKHRWSKRAFGRGRARANLDGHTSKTSVEKGMGRASLENGMGGSHLKNESTSGNGRGSEKARFWDYRPFTRVVVGFKNVLNLRDYIRINNLEGLGHDRASAKFWVKFGAIDSG